jgi:transcriptional regulatory protein RtcR
VLRVCRESETLAAAGRKLFEKSRLRKTGRQNDTACLKKYLAKFGLAWGDVK